MLTGSEGTSPISQPLVPPWSLRAEGQRWEALSHQQGWWEPLPTGLQAQRVGAGGGVTLWC